VHDTLSERLEETAEDAQAAAEAQWLAQSQPWRDELTQIQDEAEEIYREVQDELERLSEVVEQRLAPLRHKLRDLEWTVMQAMDAFAPDLPARPQAEEVAEHETPWLYDSQRVYMEQLRAYKSHSNGTHPEERDE
jgi:hypothetical protein